MYNLQQGQSSQQPVQYNQQDGNQQYQSGQNQQPHYSQNYQQQSQQLGPNQPQNSMPGNMSQQYSQMNNPQMMGNTQMSNPQMMGNPQMHNQSFQQDLNQSVPTAYQAYPPNHPQIQQGSSPHSYQSQTTKQGWNDAPIRETSSFNVSEIIASVPSPQGHIVSTLANQLNEMKMKHSNNTSSMKLVNDTELRIQVLTDKLASSQISDPVLAHLIQISNALIAKDYSNALASVMALMTSNTSEAKWVVGVKRVIEYSA